MMIWRRKVGDSIVVGDDTVISVSQVSSVNGEPFQGTVSLGFAVPPGVLVQRAETYVMQNERPAFPQFYRYVNKETERVYGYAFEPPSEPSTLTTGYRCELISGYEDMTESDHCVEILLFRSEAEAEACVIGASAAGEVGNDFGVIKHLHGKHWAVMFDYFERDIEDGNPNPVIRSFAEPSPRVMEAIKGGPRRVRKAG